MQSLKQLFLGSLLLCLSSFLYADAVPTSTNLLKQAIDHPQKIHLILVSQPGCSYCTRVKNEVLEPMINSHLYDDYLIITQIEINNGKQLIDFQGLSISTNKFASRYDAWATPTLLFLNTQGNNLTDKMVGYQTPDFYGYYVDLALEKARSHLQ